MRFGFVIGTYGAHKFIELGVKQLQSMGIKDILVVDDCSDEQEELKEVCNRCNVELFINEKKLGHLPGDCNVFAQGLKWCVKNKFDVLVKLSRRFICLKNPIDTLEPIVERFNAPTYSVGNPIFCLPMRTDCVALKVDMWKNYIDKLVFDDETREAYSGAFEKFFCSLSKEICEDCFDQTRNVFYNDLMHWGFIYWEFTTFDILRKCDNFLWRMCNNPKDYYELAIKDGIECEFDDFSFEGMKEDYWDGVFRF